MVLSGDDEQWAWRPLRDREDVDSSYHTELFDVPFGPTQKALDEWIADAIDLASEFRLVERVNVLASDEVVDPRGGRAAETDVLHVVDLVFHVIQLWMKEISTDRQATDHYQPYVSALMQRLGRVLRDGRSVYQVGELPNGTYGLVRRVDEASARRAEYVMGADAIAVAHLRRAWQLMYQRNPEPGQALNEAVLALESSGRSIITPTDREATLGKMITALRDKPEKWSVAVGTTEQVCDRLSAIWSRQPRHGGDEENPVAPATPELAEAAVHEAVTLVHWFRSGLFQRR